MLCKRRYDMAGCTDKTLKVFLNGSPVPVKTFKQYAELYVPKPEVGAAGGPDEGATILHEVVNDRYVVFTSVCLGQNELFFFLSFFFSDVSFLHWFWSGTWL
jgi:hypothetical protein